MMSSNNWNSRCFLKIIDIFWRHNYHSQFWLCSFVVKAVLPLPVVLDIYCCALQLQTEHIHIQTTVNLQTTIDYCPRNFKNHWNQWLDPQKTFKWCQNHLKTIKVNSGMKRTLFWFFLVFFYHFPAKKSVLAN